MTAPYEFRTDIHNIIADIRQTAALLRDTMSCDAAAQLTMMAYDGARRDLKTYWAAYRTAQRRKDPKRLQLF